MPIYEFACPTCRRIYSFLSKRINPSHSPVCPKCGRKDLVREMSAFAMLKGVAEPSPKSEGANDPPMPDFDDPKIMGAMQEMEADMDHLDENNPRHMAHMMKKLKNVMPPGSIPKEFDTAIRRLEAGEDPEKIEEDMGDVLGGMLGGPEDEEGGGPGGARSSYPRDSGLYDY